MLSITLRAIVDVHQVKSCAGPEMNIEICLAFFALQS